VAHNKLKLLLVEQQVQAVGEQERLDNKHLILIMVETVEMDLLTYFAQALMKLVQVAVGEQSVLTQRVVREQAALVEVERGQQMQRVLLRHLPLEAVGVVVVVVVQTVETEQVAS
jgi:hypothetical protein